MSICLGVGDLQHTSRLIAALGVEESKDINEGETTRPGAGVIIVR